MHWNQFKGNFIVLTIRPEQKNWTYFFRYMNYLQYGMLDLLDFAVWNSIHMNFSIRLCLLQPFCLLHVFFSYSCSFWWYCTSLVNIFNTLTAVLTTVVRWNKVSFDIRAHPSGAMAFSLRAGYLIDNCSLFNGILLHLECYIFNLPKLLTTE